LWDYALVWISEILSHTARGKDGTPGIEQITGQTADISEWLIFDFYDMVWYHENKKEDMTTDSVKLGRWLGVAHRVGSDMCYWILTKSGKVISTTTVQHVTRIDTVTPEIAARVDLFNEAVNHRHDDTNFQLADDITGLHLDDIDADGDLNTTADGNIPTDEEYNEMKFEEKPEMHDDATADGNIPTDEEYNEMKFEEKPEMHDDDGMEFFDNYIGSEITVQRGDTSSRARVKTRTRHEVTGDLVGRRDHNPYLSTASYDVEFPDGEIESYTANQVAENLYSQCHDERNMFLVLSEIVDHKKGDDAIATNDGFVRAKNGNFVPKRTTRGWKLLVEWRDGT
jgi:hypothetical protein